MLSVYVGTNRRKQVTECCDTPVECDAGSYVLCEHVVLTCICLTARLFHMTLVTVLHTHRTSS
jgi:hypothetical protein